MTHREYFAAQTSNTVERDRLRALEAANDPKSCRHMEHLGVGPGWRCIDIGAGAGSLVRWMSGKVGEGRVVAADVDTRFLDDIVRPNVEVRLLDVLKDDLEESTYDLVHCRFVLMHLDDPELAIRRMIGATRPGGWVLIEEPDFSSYRAVDAGHPRSEDFSWMVQGAFANAGRSSLFDPYFGLRTRALLEQFGLAEVGGEGTAYIWRGGEAEAEEHARSLSALVRAGVCPEHDAQEMHAALADPTFTFVGHTMFSAWGRVSH